MAYWSVGDFAGRPFMVYACEQEMSPLVFHGFCGTFDEASAAARELVLSGRAITAEVREIRGAWRNGVGVNASVLK